MGKIANLITGIKSSMFSKELEVDKKIQEKLKNIKAGSLLFNEMKKGCADIDEYDRKVHLSIANGCIDKEMFDSFKTDKSVEAYEKVMKATDGLKAEDKKKALTMIGVVK